MLLVKLKKSRKKRMEALENCCAKLYTKACFIYRKVNTALRDNDQTKLHTLGPYCFLVFNYIGHNLDNNFSIRQYFPEKFRLNKSKLVTVFRGDYISHEMLQEYRQAAGDNTKHFKWLPFISTSREQNIAEDFAQNALYIIQIECDASNDQYVDLSTVSWYREEKEILLQPGVRFRVIKVEFDDTNGIYLIYIIIVRSYVSILR